MKPGRLKPARFFGDTMESLILTPRLACLASLVPEGARLADIGTDHGKLPISLLKAGRVSTAAGSDIREGPLRHAEQNAREHGVSLPLRLAPGLAAFSPAECDTISIAGMGGETIAEILAAAPWTLQGQHLLLLQPMTGLPELRQWLWQNGCMIEKETVCREGAHRFYVVISARGGGQKQDKPLCACYVSHALLQASDAKAYLEHLLRIETRALSGMEQGSAVAGERLTAQRNTVHALRAALEGSL